MKQSNGFYIALIAGILILSLLAGGIVWLNLRSSTKVLVTVGGEPCGTFDLRKDQTIVLEPEDGSWHNTLQIKDGKASIIEADCDNQICVHTPALSEDFAGIIVCLPHGLVVELIE